MKNNVLIITSSYDTHADFLSPKITQKGSKVFRFNTDRLNRYEIDFRICPKSFSLRDKKEGWTLHGSNIDSVWYRKPSPDRTLDTSFDDESKRFFRSETKEFIKSITFALKNSFWVTAPGILHKARLKTVQLDVAESIGLHIPRTLVSRDRRVIQEFFRECHEQMVVKTLKLQYVESDDSYYTLRAHEICRTDLRNHNLYISPSMFQEKIEAVYELRVVVIGRHFFPFKVVCTKKNRVLDIKSHDMKDIKYTPCEIPADLCRKIVLLLNRFSLPFSSMDFLVDGRGTEYFIDLNPNGQWLWLELLTGTVMSDMFARMLVTGKLPT